VIAKPIDRLVDNEERESSGTDAAWLPRVCAILIGAGVAALAFLTDRKYSVEEIGLFNAPYMVAKYGKASFPAYAFWYPGAYDSMWVHPPVHYTIVGLLMKLGMGFYYAEAFPMVAMSFLILYFVVSGRFPTSAKLGLLCGFAAMMTVVATVHRVDHSFHVRPDFQVALAWLCGLVALENARLDEWNQTKLLVGGFLVTFASGLHYFAWAGFTGLAVYVGWAYRSLGSSQATRRIIALSCGACLFGIPYLLFFVRPNWPNIMLLMESVPYVGTLHTLQSHFETYSRLADLMANSLGGFAPAQGLELILRLHIPPFLVGLALLTAIPATRGLGLAALPLPLTLLVYIRRQAVNYLVSDYAVFFLGIGVASFVMLQFVADRWLPSRTRRPVLCVAAASFILFSFANAPMREVNLSLEVRTHGMHLERAAAREILGPGSTVGSRLGLWYTAGATHWFDVTHTLLWTLPDDLPRYLARFDALAEYPFLSERTATHVTIPSLYVSGLLHLRGFTMLSGPDTSVALFSSRQPAAVRGYVRSRGALLRFDGNVPGSAHVLSLVCSKQFLRADFGDYRHRALSGVYYRLPKGESGSANAALVLLLLDQQQYDEAKPALSRKCTLNEEFRGRVTPLDPNTLLQRFFRNEERVVFYRTLEDLIAVQNTH
jgi:hypothetical protein